MEEGKVSAILYWHTPTIVKELQRFLGFANFCCRFIHSFRSITTPLTNRSGPQFWNPAATKAMQQLKLA